MQELYSEGTDLYDEINLYKNDIEMLKKCIKAIENRYFFATTVLYPIPRTKDGYYLVPFR